MKVLLNRFLGFSAIPLIGLIAPFFLLPIAADVAGVDGWAAIGAAQAIGTTGAMISTYGWSLNGAAKIVLSANENERHRVWADSFWSRLLVLIAFSIVGGALAWAIAPESYRWLAAAVVVATATAAMTVSWYGVGLGSVRTVLFYETLPISIAVASAIPLLLLTGEPLWYPLMTFLGAITGPLLLNLRLFGTVLPPFIAADIRAVLRSNLSIAASDAIGGSYTTAPVPVTQAMIGAPAAAALTSADKVYRLALFTVTVLANTLQRWVLEVSFAEGRLKRHAIALSLHLVLAVIGGTLLAVLGAPVSTLLFNADKTPEPEIFALYGVVFGIIALTTPLIRNVLIPAGRNKTVLAAICTAAVVGLTAMFLASQYGSYGVVAGLAASEVVVLLVVGIASVRILISHRHDASAPEGDSR